MDVMESESCLKKMKNDTDSSRESFFLEKVKVIEAKDNELLKPIDKRVSLGPITPNPDRETGEVVLDCFSPLSWVSSTPGPVCSDAKRIDDTTEVDSSPQTPKEDLFDSFAPGPDDLMLAPKVIKHIGKSCTSVSRRLNFDSSPEDFNESSERLKFDSSPEDHNESSERLNCDASQEDSNQVSESGNNDNVACRSDDATDEVFLHEEVLLETMYESLLDAIVSKQTEEIIAENIPDGMKTPTSLPLLSGITETCPPAPVKPPSGSRCIDLAIRRKLEF
ncbi:hypothetical protein C5167_002217 [Papaver somniferum]|uniref:Uncharacterized protein n=2 Tax=Papaver somniferum TaxID=3469 RepID=A0A4Y7L1F3_PAPSO|nr:hypothetical protein C5167_002217 [Papaver somniferum]